MPNKVKREGGRTPRIVSLLEHKISDYFQQEMELPGLVSISGVDAAANMYSATIWLSIYGADEQEVLKMLSKETGKIRKYLGRHLVTRYVPQLRFKSDPSQAHAQAIAEKLKDI